MSCTLKLVLGGNCPRCGSNDIRASALDVAGGDELQDRRCNRCGHFESWLRSVGPTQNWQPRPLAPIVPHALHAGGSDATERALLDEIRAAPDDDAARQIYADRLLERGDPLGTFMALQLNRISGEHEPTETERQLCDEHWRAWIGAPHVLLSSTAVAFERGMWSACDGFDGHETSRLLRDPARWPELLHAPAWSTVRRCGFNQLPEDAVPILLAGPLSRSLHALRIESQRMLDLVVGWRDPPFRLRELAYHTFWRTRRPPPGGFAHMPHLEKLVARCAHQDATAWIEAAAAAPAVHTLEVLVDDVLTHHRNLPALFASAARTRLERVAFTSWPTRVTCVRAADGELVAHEVAILPGEPRPATIDELGDAGALVAELRAAFGWTIDSVLVPPRSPGGDLDRAAAAHRVRLAPFRPSGYEVRPRLRLTASGA